MSSGAPWGAGGRTSLTPCGRGTTSLYEEERGGGRGEWREGFPLLFKSVLGGFGKQGLGFRLRFKRLGLGFQAEV